MNKRLLLMLVCIGPVARTLNPEAILGAPRVGFTCGVFDFSSIISL